MDKELGVDSFSFEELDELFKEDMKQETPPASTLEEPVNHQTEPVDTTKAFAKRLKESTDKARTEEREAIAKELGFDSYAELQKNKEAQLYKDKGLNPDDVSPIVEQLVKERMETDPRLKELEIFKKQQVAEFAKRELAEITELTDGEVKELSQLSPEVRELWAKRGSLKSAYLELEGEKLIRKARNVQSKGTTSHLETSSGGAPTPSATRPLTADEKKLWKFFNPNMTDEDLNKTQVEN